MMKWQIPAKTFLLGEYAAIAEASAILLTTSPYFELTLTNKESLSEISSQSPAGIWWQKQQNKNQGLSWIDPYKGRGGLGASSAQFLACYLATCHLRLSTPTLNDMLGAYYESSWTGKGLRPSGYDVIAQTQRGCVYINRQKKIIRSFQWPFQDLSFVLIHTGVKLATHYHLQEATLPSQTKQLSNIVDKALLAFDELNSAKLIQAVNEYHLALDQLDLVAQHSLNLIRSLQILPEVLAIKGCGALGADIILLITEQNNINPLILKLLDQKLSIIATEKNLSYCNPLL